MVDLITGIIILAIGLFLVLISRAFQGTVRTVLYYLGLALIIIGAIVVIIAVVYIAMLVAAPLAAVGLLPSPLT
jgi:hypothetical protein